MKLDVFCAWGDGPDVGINIQRAPEEVAAFVDPGFVAIDFTAAEARELARKLLAAAEEAEYHETESAKYTEEITGVSRE